MIEPVEVDVVLVPLSTTLKHNQLILIVPSFEISTVELFLRFIHIPLSCTAHERNAVIVSTGLLNSPDLISANGSKSEIYKFEMQLHTHAFDGPLAANDQSIALARMELGLLKPGAYQFVLNKTISGFIDLEHSERIVDSVTTHQCINFNCA